MPGAAAFSLQSVVLEYVTDRLVAGVFDEVQRGQTVVMLEPFEPAQAAGRLGQLILPSTRLDLGRLLERRDASDDFLQARLARSARMVVFQTEKPLALRGRGGIVNTVQPAPSRSKDDGSRRRQAFGLVDTWSHSPLRHSAGFTPDFPCFSAASMRLSMSGRTSCLTRRSYFSGPGLAKGRG